METESMLKILICVQTFFPLCSLYIHSLWYQKKKHDAWILRFKKLNTFFYRSVAGLTNWSTVKVSGWVGPAAGRRLYTHTHPVEAETLERSWWRRLENNGRLVWTTALVLSQSLCVSERASEGVIYSYRRRQRYRSTAINVLLGWDVVRKILIFSSSRLM